MEGHRAAGPSVGQCRLTFGNPDTAVFEEIDDLQLHLAGRRVALSELDAHRSPGGGATRTAISEGIVALLKEFYGVGPTQAKTHYHDDLVVCLLRGGFTRVERTLLEGGRMAAVIQQQFQEVMRARFVAVIENATGREVVGFMSGNQQDPDMICEIFVLAPTDLLDDPPGS